MSSFLYTNMLCYASISSFRKLLLGSFLVDNKLEINDDANALCRYNTTQVMHEAKTKGDRGSAKFALSPCGK